MKSSETMTEDFYPNLFKVLDEVEKLEKDAENPYFKSNYADLNALLDMLKPVLKKHGFRLIIPPEAKELSEDFVNILEAILMDEEGSYISASLKIPDLEDAQKIGAAITYFRRYLVKSLLNIQDEDDDGESAVGRGKGYSSSKGSSNGKTTKKKKRGKKETEEEPEDDTEESEDDDSTDSFQKRGKGKGRGRNKKKDNDETEEDNGDDEEEKKSNKKSKKRRKRGGF